MTAALQAQTTLYSDTFGGSGAALNGVLVEGGSLQTGAVAWSANSAFLDNGSIDGANEGSAILPFSPQLNATYTLSMDVTNTTDRWIGLGFKNSALATPGGNDFADRFSNGGGVSWMLYRDHLTDPTQDIQLFSGPNVDPAIADNDVTFNNAVSNNLKIVLDTTGNGSSYTADFFLNGASISSGPQLINLPTSTIQYVGLTFDNATATPVSYDNFLLTELITGPVINQWNVDADGVFSNGANWTQGAPTANSDVSFGPIITANRTVTLSSSASLNSINFNNAGDGDYFLVPQASETLTLAGDASIVTSGRHWLRIPVAGASGLNASGAGELVLDAANTFTGGVTVDDANLAIVNTQALPSGNAITIQNNGQVQFWGPDNGFFTDQGSTGYASGTISSAISIDATSQLAINDGAVMTLSGAITGAGGVAVNGGVATVSTAKTYTGQTTINGGSLRLTGAGTLGASDGTAAAQTVITGNEATGQLQLPGGISVGDELLVLGARQLTAADAVHVTSAGSNSWAGNIKGDAGGSQYNIESTSGTLQLSGILSAPDSGERNFVFSGAGNVNVTGKITDLATNAEGDPEPGPVNNANNVNVVKRGSGTLTIRTATNNNDDFWLGDTVIEQGTLEVISDGANNGELKSASIAVRAGAVFDVDHFGNYALQELQSLGGGGTVGATGKTVDIYDDNSLTPGDNGVGTLTIQGAASLNGINPATPGTLNYDLGNTATTIGGTENDLISITGALTTTGSPTMTLNVTPVEGDLASDSYRLISHAGGTTTFGGVTPQVVDNAGNVLNPRQSLSVSGATAGQVNLVVSGNEAALTWNGAGASAAWDVNSTPSWTGGASTFRDLDDVTFGAGGSKQVVINSVVSPGMVTFNSASTYAFSGTGGMTGYGPVNVNAGTVKLFNEGNNYRGATTVASGARLEVTTASTGGMNVNGTLAVKNNLNSAVIDDFSGSLAAYTNTRILDANGGASNTYQWQITNGSLEIATTVYDGIQQSALTRTDVTLGVGEELRVDYSADNVDSQDIGLYVGAGTPTADVRQNYVAMYSRNNGQVFSRGFDGATEFGLAGGETPENLDGLFVRRLADDVFEAGYYASGVRTVITTRTITNGNAAGIGSSVGFYSDVRGVGVRGNVDNLSIGSGSASNVLSIDGDLALAGTGILEFDVSGSGFTSLDLTGTATLAGTIQVNLLDSFMPAEGASYDLIAAALGIVDSGFSFNLPALTSGLVWDTSTFADNGVLSVVAAGLAGDFNTDGSVNGADFLAWQRGFGSTYDATDLADWESNFGTTAATTAVGAVPEPTSAALLAVLAAGGLAVARVSRFRAAA
ncbi:MAG: autotransporter-associated beta strand repeat-containing protein [Planctomycetales bacterium]|nr:autotransporter-associated beta strand repeat-containing protein [Planctomycetales bacterium]